MWTDIVMAGLVAVCGTAALCGSKQALEVLARLG